MPKIDIELLLYVENMVLVTSVNLQETVRCSTRTTRRTVPSIDWNRVYED